LAQKQNKKDKEWLLKVVITSKTQIKEKELNVKTLGYLPRVLFFNAFELGTVICKDAHVGAI
jgi:hypothetical protein